MRRRRSRRSFRGRRVVRRTFSRRRGRMSRRRSFRGRRRRSGPLRIGYRM